MSSGSRSQHREKAVADLAKRSPNFNAAKVVDRLTAGLDMLGELLTVRIHDDVEQNFGVDSMLAPLSSVQATDQLDHARAQMDAYMAWIVAEEGAAAGYVAAPHGTTPQEWLWEWSFALRLGDGHSALREQFSTHYRGASNRSRRLQLVAALEHASPESWRTPRLIFSLLPWSVRIAIANAFDDGERAQRYRGEQLELLPAIGDCASCRGRVLDNGAKCPECENPLWSFRWLQTS